MPLSWVPVSTAGRTSHQDSPGAAMMKEFQRVFRLLPPGLRAHWVWLLRLILLAAGVEAVGATAIFGLSPPPSFNPATVARVVMAWPMPDFVRTGGDRTVALL